MRVFCLYLTAVACGFCMMALEILGPRYLSPRFGSSVDVWAAIISVFILSLSIGYWLGGRIADRAKTNAPLGWVIIGASAFFLLLPAYAHPFIESLGKGIHTARWGSLLAGLVLFLPPSMLLGFVSPMLVKLVFIGAERVGRTTGTLYAVSAFGNVMGILFTDYVLLAAFHLNTSTIGMGVVLALTGVTHVVVRLQAHHGEPGEGHGVPSPSAVAIEAAHEAHESDARHAAERSQKGAD